MSVASHVLTCLKSPLCQNGADVGKELAQEILNDELFTEKDKDAKVAIIEDDEDSPDDCIFISQSEEWADDGLVSDEDARWKIVRPLGMRK